jgi:hypothetical protein
MDCTTISPFKAQWLLYVSAAVLLELLILPTERIYEVRMALTINSEYFPVHNVFPERYELNSYIFCAQGKIFNGILYVRYLHLLKVKPIHKR